MDELIGSLWAGRGRISCQGRSLMLTNLPPFFDHSRHKLLVHRLPIALDVLAFEGEERLSQPFVERVGWGKGKYLKADLPKEMYIRRQSLVEPQIYHARIDMPESIRKLMLKGEKTFCRADAKWITDYRKAIVIGLAPGGIVKVWVTGPCLSPIEVTRVQAKIDPTGPNDGLSDGKFVQPSAESKAYVEKFGIPYGSW